jgi:hypothetical protein
MKPNRIFGVVFALTCCNLVAGLSYADCGSSCAVPTRAPIVVAGNYGSSSGTHSATNSGSTRSDEAARKDRSRAKYWQDRRETEAARDSRERATELHQEILGDLEEKLKRARGGSDEESERVPREKAYCMYDTNGVLIHARRGSQCEPGSSFSSSASAPREVDGRASRPHLAPAGCFKGNCSGGHGTYIFEDGSPATGQFVTECE